MGMTGQLKTFFDHMAYRWMSHRPLDEMKNKVAIAVSTTAGAGAGIATKQIAKQLFWWGIPKVYRLNQAVAASKWEDVKPKTKAKIKQKAMKIEKKVKRKHGKVRRGLRQKLIFNDGCYASLLKVRYTPLLERSRLDIANCSYLFYPSWYFC